MAKVSKPIPAPKDKNATVLDNTGTVQPGANVDRWRPPAGDEEFVFESIDAAPAWIDRNWAGFDRGPALQLPAGDLYGKAPYTTVTARVGDKVVFTAAKGSSQGKFTVIPGEPAPGSAGFTQKPAQATNASLEDMLKTGHMAPEELGSDAAAQVAARSPELADVISGDAPPPVQQVSGTPEIKGAN